MIWIDFDLITCGLEVLQDDSVYNYKVARNIVEGKGITFEEGEPIFAYHPPSVLFIIPFIALFPDSKILPIQCLLTLYTFFSLATALFIYRIVRRISDDSAAQLSAVFWILGYGIVLYSINGADTPVTVFLLALSMDFFLQKIRFAEKPSAGRYAVLGALCGLCIYSRMDTLLILPAFALQIIWTHRHHLFWAGIRKIVTAGVAMAVAVVIVTAPFFLRHVIQDKSFEVHNAASNRTFSIVMGRYARTLRQKEGLTGLRNTSQTTLNPRLTHLDEDYYPIWWGLYAFCFAKSLAVLPVKYSDVFLPLTFFGVAVLVTVLWRKRGHRFERLRAFYEESGIGPLG